MEHEKKPFVVDMVRDMIDEYETGREGDRLGQRLLEQPMGDDETAALLTDLAERAALIRLALK